MKKKNQQGEVFLTKDVENEKKFAGVEPEYPTGEGALKEILERLKKNDEQLARLQQEIKASASKEKVKLPENMKVAVRALRANRLPLLTPSDSGKKTAYVSKYRLHERVRDGSTPSPGAEPVGELVPMETARDIPVLIARQEAKEQLARRHEDVVLAEARRKAKVTKHGIKIETEYERSRGGVPTTQARGDKPPG